jgi:hypothetical protein
MSTRDAYIPFSQRTGLTPVPPQLQLGEVSTELRRLIDYGIDKEVRRAEKHGYGRSCFEGKWLGFAMDFHVKFLKQSASSFENSGYIIRGKLESLVGKGSIGLLFDLVEFFVRHPDCSGALKSDLASAFVTAKAAYRIVDGLVVAIGSEHQAQAFENAVSTTESVGASAARQHLINAGLELRHGNWADSVRESIHSVESMARMIEPRADTLGPALKALETKGYIHGSLKAAFEKLYGYTNDEGGIRHALLDDQARVDEADALFMLGVCASFVSYLISRDGK